METIFDRCYEDIPQQFHDKVKIEMLIKSYSRQLEELKQVFGDLDNRTDIETAIGKVLDDVGTIVGLNRKEAGLLAGVGVEEPVILDERYRQFLKYKILKNTNNCTYSDIMDGISFFFTGNLYYSEPKEHPASFLLTTDKMDLDDNDIKLYEVPIIKASGVAACIREVYYTSYQILMLTYDASLKIIVPYYPRGKQELLRLDGAILLDGSYNLSGYETGEYIELYPLTITMKSKIKKKVAYGSGQIISVEVAKTLKYDTKMRLHNALKKELNITTIIQLKSRNLKFITYDSSLITKKEHYLEGGFFLDGMVLLDAERSTDIL